MNLKNRKGILEISHRIIHNNPEIVRLILGEVIVVEANSLFIKDSIEYHALSKHFREVEMGEVIPTYIATIDINDAIEFVEIG